MASIPQTDCEEGAEISRVAETSVPVRQEVSEDGLAEVAAPTGIGFRSWLGLTRSDQWFLGVVVSVGVASLLVYSLRLNGWGVAPLVVEHPPGMIYRVDINRATWVEWAQLEGLGEKLAREIVADREANGPFKSVDELVRVRGIGATNLERFRPWLVYEPDAGDQKREGSALR